MTKWQSSKRVEISQDKRLIKLGHGTYGLAEMTHQEASSERSGPIEPPTTPHNQNTDVSTIGSNRVLKLWKDNLIAFPSHFSMAIFLCV